MLRAHPRPQRAQGRGLDHRAVGDGVAERNAKLDHVGPALDQRVEQGLRSSRDRDRRASGRPRTRPHWRRRSARTSRRSGRHARSPRTCCACAMSLSPRPDRLTSRIGWSSRSSASFSACASAWQLSNAPTMPSDPRQRDEGVERGPVLAADIIDASDVLEMGMLGADRGIIEPRRDRPAVADLPVGVLQDRASRRRGGCPAAP